MWTCSHIELEHCKKCFPMKGWLLCACYQNHEIDQGYVQPHELQSNYGKKETNILGECELEVPIT